MRTLIPAEKLEELTHSMGRYPWNIHVLGFCEMPSKNFGEMSTNDGHEVYFSEEKD